MLPPKDRRRRQPPRRSDEPSPTQRANWTEAEQRAYQIRTAMATPLADVSGISVRTVNMLEEAGIILVAQLMQQQTGQLLALTNFGGRTLAELRRAMRGLGLTPTWKMPPRPHAKKKPPANQGDRS